MKIRDFGLLILALLGLSVFLQNEKRNFCEEKTYHKGYKAKYCAEFDKKEKK